MSENNIISKSSAEYRLEARERLAGNWGKFALLYLIIGVATLAIGFIPVLGTFAEIALGGPLALGITLCMMKLFKDEPVILEDVLEGFRHFVPALLVYLLIALFTILWGLLFIIPGIVAGYSYSMTYYILLESPDMPPTEVLRRSKAMMKGHRMDLFILHLTFIGWILLTILTLGIGSLWLTPYIKAATTAFYLDLKTTQAQSGEQPFSEY